MKRLIAFIVASAAAPGAAEVPIDLSGYDPGCGVGVRRDGERLEMRWPMEDGEEGVLALDLRAGRPLIELIAVASAGSAPAALAERVDPVFFLTIGTRVAPAGRPPELSIWDVFFDNPARRPHEARLSRLDPKRARVASTGRRASIAVGDLAIGSFAGEIVLTAYAGARLLHVEAAVSTAEDGRAIFYDAGLAGESPGWRRFAWRDTAGRLQGTAADPAGDFRPLAVRHRAIIAESPSGSLACFPPPHQFFYPRDLTDNLRYVWHGRGHHGLEARPAFGIRQQKDGGGNFVPWFNAPPRTLQRLGVFYLLSRGGAEEALDRVLRFTHGDRFPALPGYLTFTSHWHMAIAVQALKWREEGWTELPVPDLKAVFKGLGINMVHLAEFHGDGHQRDPGPLRLPEIDSMFSECRRLSDGELLLIPGEELNTYLGLPQPGKHPGHWMSLFPRPVDWIQLPRPRAEGEPFAEERPGRGVLYRVGGREDMMELLRRENGLAWAAHPRIKASSWTPDIFRQEDFYLADSWLGGAWKAMPGDLSRERLGERCLDLLDDMANWGQKKYLPGEVDVFKIDRTHELYGHMNANYLRLDRLPRFDEGWQPVLDVLRSGKFFVTTGEVLIREFTAGGRESGETLELPPGAHPEVRALIEWTFPMRSAELISGDGNRVYRERIDLSDTSAFGSRALTLRPDLRGRRWIRFEAWDIAFNGAYTQPVWLDSKE